MNKQTVGGAALALGLAFAPTATAASVADLAWMTGTWAGPIGPGELEENWTVPKAGSIQALVRMTGGGKTSMVELIVIEEEAGDDGEATLRLRLMQWNPGLVQRPGPHPAVMKLIDMGDNTVAFEAESEGAAIAKLRYTRDGELFTISVGQPDGNTMDIPLKMVRRGTTDIPPLEQVPHGQ